MFSHDVRCVYERNQLAEVICQLRFPEILSIQTELPAAFQEAIREDYPCYTSRVETPAPKLSGVPGQMSLQKQQPVTNYQFTSADGLWRINLTSRFISLSCGCYTRWEDFAHRLDKPLAAFIRIYHPAFFERVGLRYINFFSRADLGLEGTSFADLIAPCYLGPLMEEDVAENAASRCSVDVEMALRGGCRMKLHAGPGLVKRQGISDQEIKFILDQDLYLAERLEIKLFTGALNTLHAQADSVFRGAITPLLHDAMGPEAV